MLLLLLPVPWIGPLESEVPPLGADSVVDREPEFGLGLGIVPPALKSGLVLDDKEFELPVPLGIGKGGIMPVPWPVAVGKGGTLPVP